MKNTSFTVFLIVSFAAFASANKDNENWPYYLKKCSKSNPDLSTCLVNHANRALDSIFTGDNKIGIPSFLPLLPGDLSFGKNRTFKIEMHEVKIFWGYNLHIVNMDWNFDNKTINIHFIYNNAHIIDANYKSSGSFKDLNLTGIGHSKLIFVAGSRGGKKSYNMKYEIVKVLGNEYAQIKESQCSYENGFRIEFQNLLLSKEQGEAHRKFLNKHSNEVDDALRPELNELICSVIDTVFNSIFFNFPLDLIFDS